MIEFQKAKEDLWSHRRFCCRVDVKPVFCTVDIRHDWKRGFKGGHHLHYQIQQVITMVKESLINICELLSLSPMPVTRGVSLKRMTSSHLKSGLA